MRSECALINALWELAGLYFNWPVFIIQLRVKFMCLEKQEKACMDMICCHILPKLHRSCLPQRGQTTLPQHVSYRSFCSVLIRVNYIAAGAKPGWSMPTFHSHCHLWKVEVILIGQVDDVMIMMKEKNLIGRQSNISLVKKLDPLLVWDC